MDHGLTVAQLADKTKLSGSTIYKIEQGNHCPNESTVECIAEAFGVLPEEIFLPRGLTHLGKTAHGGGRVRRNTDSDFGKLCTGCFTQKSLTGNCICVI